VVGQCSAHLAGRRARYRHRAVLGLVLLRDYWGLGIGGKMMEECLAWCRAKGLEQAELGVIKGNERAMNMYKSFGFEVVGETPRFFKYADGTYASEYYMVKQL
jgi:ribosomal protein S18 acetylase RimI-like enzyme